MYDLHCHMLPSIDDGARDLEMALSMARMAVEDGITHLACTPHIYPGMYENTSAGIARATSDFRRCLEQEGIELAISYGADIQVVPELVSKLKSHIFPTLNGSNYFLFEPPHHVPLPNFQRLVFEAVSAGFVPIITHPERLTWLDEHYQEFIQAVEAGALIQLTAGSVVGRFGKTPQYWSEHMLDDGIVHLLATDAHNLRSRAPLLSEGCQAAAKWVGAEEVRRMVMERPRHIWHNGACAEMAWPPGLDDSGLLLGGHKKRGFWNWLHRHF